MRFTSLTAPTPTSEEDDDDEGDEDAAEGGGEVRACLPVRMI